MRKPQYYDPEINQAYWEWAKYYSVAVIPARIREPQDKPVVEESIGWLETWLLGWLRNQIFFNFESLNTAVWKRVNDLCQKDYQKRPGTRRSIFLEVDFPALHLLPPTRFEIADFKIKTVPDNYHVEYDEFYYSVLYTYHRQKVTIRATSSTIEIFDSNRERITSHPRRYMGNRYVTNSDHMPENHKKYWESTQWNGARYRSWAKEIGENTAYFIDRLLTSQSVEEQAYKSCMGILQMAKKYSNERLESACLKAKSMNSFSYTTVKNILKNGQDLISDASKQTMEKPLPSHENIRGHNYYQ